MLKKLATPFVKFWGWLKETAWIQPLLIVGVVFAIIFSISPIVQAINDAGNASDQAMDFLNQYKYSLEGVYGDEEIHGCHACCSGIIVFHFVCRWFQGG